MLDVANQLWLCIIVEWDGNCNGIKCCNKLIALIIHLVVDMDCGCTTGNVAISWKHNIKE